MKVYNSFEDTGKHIETVRYYMEMAMHILRGRGLAHDRSKFEEPEKTGFDLLTPEFREMEYGGPEWREVTQHPLVKLAIKHHHENNSHHPQYYTNGIMGMSLFDMIEMLCDWKAATDRNPNGNMRKNMIFNFQEFKIPHPMCVVLDKTALEMGFISEPIFDENFPKL